MAALRKPFIPIGPSIAYVPLSQGLHALVGIDDVERICGHNWYAAKRGDSYYAFRNDKSLSPKGSQGMHGFILGKLPNLEADHVVPGNGLNNLPHNLRYATRQQQAQNRRMSANNRSGFKGISPVRGSQTWKAEIRAAGKKIYLGVHATPELAHAAYVAAAKRIAGEFARSA